MKLHVELDVQDLWNMIQNEMEKRLPGFELTGVTVKSWNTVVLAIDNTSPYNTTLTEPIRHHLRQENAKLEWIYK